jgi:hypothetical protein
MSDGPERFVPTKERLAALRAEMASLGSNKGMTRRERIQMLNRLIREVAALHTQCELDELRQQAAGIAATYRLRLRNDS